MLVLTDYCSHNKVVIFYVEFGAHKYAYYVIVMVNINFDNVHAKLRAFGVCSSTNNSKQ